MSISWVPPYADFSPHSSWGWYDTRAHLSSYYRPYYIEYAAPRRLTFEGQSHVKSRFNQKNRFGAQGKKKTVIKQVCCVKKDGCKDASSDLISNDKKPIKVLETSATVGKEVKQIIINDRIVNSEQRRLEVPKIKKELPLLKSKSEPRCPLGLSSWQEKRLQRCCEQELKMKKMAWVPKKSNQNQDKSVVQASHANGVVKANKRLSHSMVNRKGVSVNTVVTGRAPQATGSKGTKFTGPDVIFVHGNEKIPVNGQLSFRGGEKLIKRVYQVKHNRRATGNLQSCELMKRVASNRDEVQAVPSEKPGAVKLANTSAACISESVSRGKDDKTELTVDCHSAQTTEENNAMDECAFGIDLSLCSQDMSSAVLCNVPVHQDARRNTEVLNHVNSSVIKINGVKLSAAASIYV
jgi:hypothetical protein